MKHVRRRYITFLQETTLLAIIIRFLEELIDIANFGRDISK